MTELADTFNAFDFIDELIVEMGMQNEAPEKLEELKANMIEALSRKLFQTAAENIEGEVIDIVMEELEDESDLEVILRTLIQASPTVQVALVLAIDEFRENTLEAYNKLNV